MRIDAQAGFVERSRFRYPWLNGAAPHMQREFTPEDLWRILSRNKYEGAIATAILEDTAETDWLLGLAQREPWICGVIGNGFEDRWLGDGRLVGIRTTDPDCVRRAVAADIAVDLPVRPPDFPAVLGLIESLPEARLCVIPDGSPDWSPEPWEALAGLPRVMVKICGLINSAGASWNAAVYRPFVQRMLERCGPERLIYGSDWPHCMHTGTWKESLAAFTQAMGAQTMEARARILGENAARHYRLRTP